MESSRQISCISPPSPPLSSETLVLGANKCEIHAIYIKYYWNMQPDEKSQNHSFGLTAIFKKSSSGTDRLGFNLANPRCSSRGSLQARATHPGYYSCHSLTGTRSAGVVLPTGLTAETPWGDNAHAEIYTENIQN